jgi:uncharacterized phage protein (TIGR01671 family)
MREIKFRAWDIGLRRWLYEDISLSSSEREENEIILKVEGIADSGIEFCQFTGLKDKNEEEIFEGDIVKCYLKQDRNHEFIDKIQWNDNDLCFELEGDFLIGEVVMEVIGNKFENPEFLGEQR